MSEIKKEKNKKKYYFVIEGKRDPLTGKRKQYRRKGFNSIGEAKIALAKLRVEIEGKNDTNLGKQKFKQFITEWLEVKKIKLKPSTIKNYQEQLQYNIIPYLGEWRLSEIDEKVLQNYVLELHETRKLAPATIRTAFGIVGEVIKLLSKKGILDIGILEEVSLPREVKKIRAWSEQNIAEFMDAPNKILNLSRHYIGLVISIKTGMRLGEVLGIRWQDIDFEHQVIVINQTLAREEKTNNYYFQDEGKTPTALRKVYIPESLIDELMQHKELIDKEKRIKGEKYVDNDLVVCTKEGNWVHPNNFRRAFKATIAQLDVPKIRLHDLRHTHATYLLSIGVNPKVVQERLGHKNINTLLNTYSHALPSMQIAAVAQFDEAFKKEA